MKWLYLFLDGDGKPIHELEERNLMDAVSAEWWRNHDKKTVDLPGMFILELSSSHFQVFISEDLIEGGVT